MTRGAAKVLFVLAGAALVAGTSFAQTGAQTGRPRGGGKPKPGAKPPAAQATQVDAGNDSPEENKELADLRSPQSDAGAAGTSGPVPPPPASGAREGDGGVKPSPLNPAPGEFANGSLDAGAPSIDYDRLLGDIAALRARVAAVGDSLFHARIGVGIETAGDHGKIARLTIAIDDGVVYTAPASFRADDMTAIYNHAVAPGRHAVTVEVERKDDRNDAFATSQKSRFIVEVPKDEQLDVEVKITDESTMGGDFPSDRSGRYELRVRAKAVARPLKK
jgi:hypothetical protein